MRLGQNLLVLKKKKRVLCFIYMAFQFKFLFNNGLVLYGSRIAKDFCCFTSVNVHGFT